MIHNETKETCQENDPAPSKGKFDITPEELEAMILAIDPNNMHPLLAPPCAGGQRNH